jgi:purine-nucleoside phosphorylase
VIGGEGGVRDRSPVAAAPVAWAVSRLPRMSSPAAAAAAVIAERTGVATHDVAVVLGSGWRPAADVIGPPEQEIPMAELPGFRPPTVEGHGGTIRSVRVGERRVLVLLGRTHLYEGHGTAQVAHGVRTAAAAGCRTVVLTNAAGGIREGMRVGEPVVVSDQLNLTATSPLEGPRFVDLTDLYSPALRARAHAIDPTLAEGVYAGLPGPHFETPAEIRMLRGMGADLVGMSTVLEAIAARAEGVDVFGLSLVTNLAAGITGEPLDHKEVLAAGAASAGRMGALLRELVA